nr:hypothetical protein [Tanacetum cinerariifolium]
MLNKDNYVPWSSRIIRYARSRPNGKMIVDSIENGPYVRRMIATPGEPDLPMDADDQAIQTILLGLPEDVYAAVDSCETAKEIWEHVRQIMKGSNIREQEKKAKLFNEWEKFTTHPQQSFLINNKYNPQPPLNQNFMQPPLTSLEDINDPTEAINNGGIQGAQNAGVQSSGNQNGLVVAPGIANQSGTGNQASTSGIQHDRDLIYDTNGSAE